METETPPSVPVPGYSTGYPDNRQNVGRAWSHAWNAMRAAGPEYLDGNLIAKDAAESVSKLKPVTVLALLSRARRAGLLEVEHRQVAGERGVRRRSFYRLPQ